MTYEVEVNECTVYATGAFIYVAETYQDVKYCVDQGMHLATDKEIDLGIVMEEQMDRVN